MAEITTTQVSTVEELSQFLRTSGAVDVTGQNSKAAFRLLTEQQRCANRLEVAIGDVLEFSPHDQVVRVGAGMLVPELMHELREHGQTIPIPFGIGPHPHLWSFIRTLGGAISMNLPHALEAQCGNWRDWILGMTVVLADGTVVKAGSKAVKNVAGFDIHKLFVGARGTLGVIADVTLRTFPRASLPEPDIEILAEWSGGALWIQRVQRTDLKEAVATMRGKLIAVDYASCTLFSEMEPDVVGLQFEGDWFLRMGYVCGDMIAMQPAQAHYVKRAKEIFDPTGKLNPGEMGMF